MLRTAYEPVCRAGDIASSCHISRSADVEVEEVDNMNENEATGTDVVVVGAGIAGLSAAIAAAEGGTRVVMLDAHEPGGRASTVERDGFQLNVGGHALYLGGHLNTMLTQRGRPPHGGVVSSSTIGVLRDGAIHPVVLSATGLLRNPVLGRRSRVRLAALFARLPRMKPAELAGSSVNAWLHGQPDDVQEFLRMFVRLSTYTHAPDLLDAGAAVAQLQLAAHGVRYLDGGWAQLVGILTGLAVDAGVIIVSRAEVTAVHGENGRVEVSYGDRSLFAKAAIVAAGGPDLTSRLTGGTVKGRESLTEPVAASCLDLALTGAHEGIVLGMDEPLYMSSHAPLAKLAPAGGGLVSLMRYLAPGHSSAEAPGARVVLREMARTAGIPDGAIIFERPLLRMVVTHGAPTARGGGLAGRPRIDALGVPGVFIAGEWVGPRGMLADASAASGEQAGRAAAELCASTSG